MLGPFRARPRLTASLAAGLAVGLACAFGGGDLRWSTSAIMGWDVTCLSFIGLSLWMMRGCTPDDIRRVAPGQDEGQHVILALVSLAAAASLYAVAIELSQARREHGPEQVLHVSLAFLTVAASWFMVQVVYALHYAHEYYAPGEGDGGSAQAGGLLFPGDDEPDYWDFVHFAAVIGAANQTADIQFTSRTIRRVGTVHSVLAFAFNTVVVALTINLVADLF
jgi:uncharacterized membrane protein